MKQIILLLSMLYLTTACSSLPKVYPPKNVSQPMLQQKCGQLFPEGNWQFFHSIEATMSGGQKGVLLGVTIISSKDRIVQSVLMTIEGMVLLDARYDRQLVINRSVWPFDSEDFAGGLIQDLQLIFFRPPGPLIESGILENGAATCRYQNPDKQVVDIVKHSDQRWELRLYHRGHKKIRTVDMFFNRNEINPGGFHVPNRLKLTSHGYLDYTLDMDLIEAVLLIP